MQLNDNVFQWKTSKRLGITITRDSDPVTDSNVPWYISTMNIYSSLIIQKGVDCTNVMQMEGAGI